MAYQRYPEVGFQRGETYITAAQHIGNHDAIQQMHMIAYGDSPALYGLQIFLPFYFQPPDRFDYQRHQQVNDKAYQPSAQDKQWICRKKVIIFPHLETKGRPHLNQMLFFIYDTVPAPAFLREFPAVFNPPVFPVKISQFLFKHLLHLPDTAIQSEILSMFAVFCFHTRALCRFTQPVIDLCGKIVAAAGLEQASFIQGKLRSSRFGAVGDYRDDTAGK